MSDTYTVVNRRKGPLSFSIMPRSALNLESFPSHKRRKALRASIIRVLVPASGSLELCSYTGLPVDELRGMPELLRLRATGACYIRESEVYTPPPAPKIEVQAEPVIAEPVIAEPVIAEHAVVEPETVEPAPFVTAPEVPEEPKQEEPKKEDPALEDTQPIPVLPPQFALPREFVNSEVPPTVTLEVSGGVSDEKPKKKRGRKPKVV